MVIDMCSLYVHMHNGQVSCVLLLLGFSPFFVAYSGEQAWLKEQIRQKLSAWMAPHNPLIAHMWLQNLSVFLCCSTETPVLSFSPRKISLNPPLNFFFPPSPLYGPIVLFVFPPDSCQHSIFLTLFFLPCGKKFPPEEIHSDESLWPLNPLILRTCNAVIMCDWRMKKGDTS